MAAVNGETLDMFGTVPQPRLTRPEPDAIYRATIFLRKMGVEITRADTHHHILNGERVCDAEVTAYAIARGYEP